MAPAADLHGILPPLGHLVLGLDDRDRRLKVERFVSVIIRDCVYHERHIGVELAYASGALVGGSHLTAHKHNGFHARTQILEPFRTNALDQMHDHFGSRRSCS